MRPVFMWLRSITAKRHPIEPYAYVYDLPMQMTSVLANHDVEVLELEETNGLSADEFRAYSRTLADKLPEDSLTPLLLDHWAQAHPLHVLQHRIDEAHRLANRKRDHRTRRRAADFHELAPLNQPSEPPLMYLNGRGDDSPSVGVQNQPPKPLPARPALSPAPGTKTPSSRTDRLYQPIPPRRPVIAPGTMRSPDAYPAAIPEIIRADTTHSGRPPLRTIRLRRSVPQNLTQQITSTYGRIARTRQLSFPFWLVLSPLPWYPSTTVSIPFEEP
jgi:hypothetical protein